MNIHFSDIFKIDEKELEKYGAFNISLLNDLPLFIDPFLLFNSEKEEYKKLHQQIIDYVVFLKNASINKNLERGLLSRWFKFSEVKQNWFGYCLNSNSGKGLGNDFALALNKNLKFIFSDFGQEKVANGSHIEKLTLIKSGIGRDNISDFTVNLIKNYLLDYTQIFTLRYIRLQDRKEFVIDKVNFNYQTESWERKEYILPCYNKDFILLTPKDILTKDETWINKNDLYNDFESIAESIPNNELRSQINNYFEKFLHKDMKRKEYDSAIANVINKYPEILDYYIHEKENNAKEAIDISNEKVKFSRYFFDDSIRHFNNFLNNNTDFYKIATNTLEETKKRLEYFKKCIEIYDGYKIFFYKGKPIHNENILQILFKFIWFDTPSDVNREVNNGGGAVDYKISKGNKDKTLVEFKLAKNSHLINILEQVKVYETANDTDKSYKVIIYFNDTELKKINKIIKELKIEDNEYVVLIDARPHKQTASQVKFKQKNDLDSSDNQFDFQLNDWDIDFQEWDKNVADW